MLYNGVYDHSCIHLGIHLPSLSDIQKGLIVKGRGAGKRKEDTVKEKGKEKEREEEKGQKDGGQGRGHKERSGKKAEKRRVFQGSLIK